MSARKLIFFPKKWGQNSITQDTKPLSNSKENRKSNDGATAPRRIYLFPQSCRRVQLLKIFWTFWVSFSQPLQPKYPHLCIKYVQSLFYHIFLKKYGLFYKKGTILLWKEEWFAFDYFKVGDWTRHGLLGGCTEQCLRCSWCRDARLLRLALPSPRFGLRHRQVLLLWVTQGHSHTCPR